MSKRAWDFDSATNGCFRACSTLIGQVRRIDSRETSVNEANLRMLSRHLTTLLIFVGAHQSKALSCVWFEPTRIKVRGSRESNLEAFRRCSTIRMYYYKNTMKCESRTVHDATQTNSRRAMTITDDPSCPFSACRQTSAWAASRPCRQRSSPNDTPHEYETYHFGLDRAIALSGFRLVVAFSLPEIPQLDRF